MHWGASFHAALPWMFLCSIALQAKLIFVPFHYALMEDKLHVNHAEISCTCIACKYGPQQRMKSKLHVPVTGKGIGVMIGLPILCKSVVLWHTSARTRPSKILAHTAFEAGQIRH